MISLTEGKGMILAKNPDMKIVEAFVFDDILAFSLVNKTDDNIGLIGGGYSVIDRNSGRIYGMTSAQLLFRKGGKKVPQVDLN